MSWTKEDQNLYKKHLVNIKKEFPEVDFIIDTTKEDADWLKKKKTNG